MLRVMEGPDSGQALVLDPCGPPHAVLGNASSCSLQLSDPHISRRHVALTATATHILLVDLGSRNGTYVNGILVREARLHGGETITIGRTTLGVETDEATAPNNRLSTLPPPPSVVSEVVPAAEPAKPDFLEGVLVEQLPFTAARQRVVAEFERRYIEDLLAKHNGNVTHAARASGVAHRYFQLVRARSR